MKKRTTQFEAMIEALIIGCAIFIYVFD